jgi:epsilon-lactone hydrolase
MPSWQNRVLSMFIRSRVKRRPINDEAKAVARVRARLENPPKFLIPIIPPNISIREVNENGIRGEWLEHKENSSSDILIYYLHGGGYVACSPKTHRTFTIALTLATKAKIFALDYRLAPEHRFPAALEDSLNAYRKLLSDGADPNKIIIGGDSAGGGLTLATLIALRDAGDPLPAAAICLSPWTDLAATGQSIITNTKRDVMFYGEAIGRGAKVYLGDAHPENPLASPLYADFTGLPPMLIYVSNSEVLLDDSVRLAERAKQNGVMIDLQVWNGLPHVWPIFVRFLPEARQAIGQMASFIKERTEASVKKEARAGA